MITRVRAKNFRSLADVDVTLGPLTILVGKNGAGKSAFVDVLRFTRDMLSSGLKKAFGVRGSFSSLRYSHSEESETIDIEIELKSRKYGFSCDFMIGIDPSCRIYEESGKWQREGFDYVSSYYVKNGVFEKWPDDGPILEMSKIDQESVALSWLGQFMVDFRNMAEENSSVEIFSVFPDGLRAINQKNKDIFFLEDGSNFSSILENTIGNRYSKNTMLSVLRRVVETVTDIRVTEAGGYLVPELQHKDGSWRNLENESDGTVRLLGILCVIYQIDTNLIKADTPLVIEEPEISIYPEYLEVIANVLREASQRRQIIITTQSPDLISCFSADEIRVVESIEGQTKIGPLGAHQREVLNQKLFSLGDLLRVEGLWRDESDA